MTAPRALGAAAAGADEPFDLEAAAKAVAADTDPFKFAYKGETYELPPQATWALRDLRLLAQGDLEGALSALLGSTKLDELSDAGLTVGELTALFDEAARRAGMGGLPNSAPPPRRGSTRK